MVFIPPPPKELQKENVENGTQPNQNKDLVRPMEDDNNFKKTKKEKKQKEKKVKPEKQDGVQETKNNAEKKQRNSTRGKVVLCVMGLLASLALIGFIVYLLVF